MRKFIMLVKQYGRIMKPTAGKNVRLVKKNETARLCIGLNVAILTCAEDVERKMW